MSNIGLAKLSTFGPDSEIFFRGDESPGDLFEKALAATDVLESDSSDEVEVVRLELKIYGNHCGPGHGSVGTLAADHVDQACYDHDRAYGRNGYFDIKSDIQLIGRLIEEQFTEDLGARERAAGIVVALAFITIMPLSLTVTLARETIDFYKKVGTGIANGVEKAWNKITSWF